LRISRIYVREISSFVEIICGKRVKVKGKDKSVPLQAWSGPEGSRNLRFSDYMRWAGHVARMGEERGV